MSQLRPSAVQERWLTVASRVGVSGRTPLLIERAGDWRTASLVVRWALAVLGIFAAALVAGIFELLRLPHAPFVGGVVSVIVAEWLIARRRLFGAGIEEALELVGLLMIAFDVQDGLGAAPETRAALLIAAACAIAGLRLLNPLFTTLAAVAVAFAIAFASGHSLVRSLADAPLTSLWCFAVALLALALGALRYQRPSHDRMLDWLVLAMPLTGYLWTAADHIWSASNNLHEDAIPHIFIVVVLLAVGFIALTVGIRRRTHSPLLAFMSCVACVAYELRGLTRLPIQARLILWGSVALVAAIALDRRLRTPWRGITSQKMSDREGLLQFVGAAALTPHTRPTEVSAFQGDGGRSGGGGASGTY